MISSLRSLATLPLLVPVLLSSGCYSGSEAELNAADSNATPEAAIDEGQGEVVDTASKALFPTSEWMRHIPDAKLLSEFSIPGTHDSLARYDTSPSTGTARTQVDDIANQLSHGVRFFDLRFSVIDYPKNPRLRGHHGVVDEKVEAPAVFSQMTQFLKAHPSETVIVSVKEENTSYPYAFEVLLGGLIKQDLARWATDEWVPRIGAVRGKIVLVRRFPVSGGWPLKTFSGGQWVSTKEGINAADGWKGSGGAFGVFNVEDAFEFQCDWTSCNRTLTDKWSAVQSHLNIAPARTDHRWYLTFSSATRYPAAQHSVPALNAIAEFAGYINPRLLQYFAGKRKNYGIVIMDFATQRLAQSVISTND